MKNIHRRKPVHSHSTTALHGSPLTDSERQSFKEEIERLKNEKERLILELQQTHEQEKQGCDGQKQLQLLKERLQNMERKQQKMTSLVTRTLQKSNIGSQSETHDRKRRLSRISYIWDEANVDDNPTGTAQSVATDNAGSTTSDLELLDHLESTLTFWENALRSFSQAYPQLSSRVELDETTSCPDSPPVSCTQLDVRTRSPGIDMNSEPVVTAAPEIVASKEPVANATPVPTGVNDMFWEQFLTENPGCASAAENQEVQSQRKDTDIKKNESKPVDNGKFWWNMRNVNSLAEQMGHLTSAERT